MGRRGMEDRVVGWGTVGVLYRRTVNFVSIMCPTRMVSMRDARIRLVRASEE
jgi:hypothetical protein